MQRNRAQTGGGGRQGQNSPSTSGVPSKSRSRSASSSQSSNTGTSTSGSSSSGSSSSSSSSGSGSDSSSSDTEASRASSRSRASRSSQKSSNQPTPVKKGPNKSTVTTTTTTNTTAANKKSNASAAKNATTPSTSSVNTTNKNRTSGTVTNTKTILPLSKGLTAKNAKRKTLIASSSDSETEPVPTIPTPIKKVGTKPAVAKPPPVNRRKKATPPAKPAAKNTPNTVATKGNAKKGNNTVAATNNSTSESANTKSNTQRNNKTKTLKSIFSPENSSEDSECDSKPTANSSSKAPTKQTSAVKGAAGSSAKNNASASTTNRKKGSTAATPAATNATTKGNKKGAANSTAPSLPAPSTPLSVKSKSASSTSLSGSGTNSSASSTSSSSDSSDSDEADGDGPSSKVPPNEQQNNEQDMSDTKNDSTPSSPASGGRKTRPVTRRQRRTVKSKTIPTTTTFNQSALTQSVSQVTAWDSDFSDEPKSLARVPAKSQQKVRLKPTEEDEEAMERERKCPFPCCDSQGHLSGAFPTHSMLPTCPKYHGFTPEECKENADERSKRENERKKYYVPNQPHHKKPRQLTQDAKNWIAKTKELKQQTTVDGLCSEYDLSLWNDALALAAQRVETEQGEGLSYRSVAMGRWEMSCWCASPYPEPLCHCRRLFICEFCLKPVQSGTVLRRHCAKCVWRHPPGDEIYRKERLSVWEVDGKSQKTYCQNLCLLAKCFLDHKTLYLDVDPFLFYVMTLADSTGCHIVGYFSKEKNQSFLNYNVSCILTLPPYQRQGFGRLLIDFSYLLTRVEGKVGSPEKPLSDLGLISYRSYWKDAVLRRMCACATREMNVKDLSIELGVTSADLISTLQFLGMLKYWKGKHLVLKKQDVLEEYLERVRRRGEQRIIDSSCLRWRPTTTD